MSSKPPFFAQERSDTCMLACLRMILAYRGQDITEQELAARADLADGLDPEQLAVLVRQFGLEAESVQIDLESIAELVSRRRFPVVLIDRTFIDREFAIHAVVPIRLSKHFVTVLDPLRGERRIALARFRKAHERVGGWAVVWK